ncbi:hypothetical protein [Chitinimonas arctica]|uniref:hypothetical protein n=1 Tax=Chitinimonas arctica TaxID=2594795 RepID=UPI0015D210B6|nr:hypothetical protein [Chitinimonas arctica]
MAAVFVMTALSMTGAFAPLMLFAHVTISVYAGKSESTIDRGMEIVLNKLSLAASPIMLRLDFDPSAGTPYFFSCVRISFLCLVSMAYAFFASSMVARLAKGASYKLNTSAST